MTGRTNITQVSIDTLVELVGSVETTEHASRLWNAASLVGQKLRAIEGLKDGSQRVDIYEHARAQTKKKWKYEWPSSQDVLGKGEHLKRVAKEKKR